MSWIVPWNGRDLDVDPCEFSGLELSLIKLRTGYTFKQLIIEVANLDADAIRALFWTVERRGDQELKFSDYAGPSMNVIVPHMVAYNEVMEELGKATGTTATPETDGSPSSPSDSDGPDASTTN